MSRGLPFPCPLCTVPFGSLFRGASFVSLIRFDDLLHDRVADHIDSALGRVAFALPEIPAHLEGVEELVASNVKEFGDVLQEVGKALMDGRIDRNEIRRLEREIQEQVRQAMALLESLKGMAEE